MPAPLNIYSMKNILGLKVLLLREIPVVLLHSVMLYQWMRNILFWLICFV